MVSCFSAQVRQYLPGRIFESGSAGAFIVISEPVVSFHGRAQPNAFIGMQVRGDHFCRGDLLAPMQGDSLNRTDSYFNNETASMFIKLKR